MFVWFQKKYGGTTFENNGVREYACVDVQVHGAKCLDEWLILDETYVA